MNRSADEIIKRLQRFPMAHKSEGNPLCCISTMGKDLKFDIDRKSNKSDIIAILNTDDIDSDKEVVVPSGLNPTYFVKNGKLFADHVYSSATAVGYLRGNGLKLIQSNGREYWKARIGIHSTDLGRDIMTIAQESGQFGFSIGFWPDDYGAPTPEEAKKYTQGSEIPSMIVRTGGWFETSATPFPCNVTCQGKIVIAADVENESKSLLDSLLSRGLIKRNTAAHYGLEDAERRSYAVATPHGMIRGTRPA